MAVLKQEFQKRKLLAAVLKTKPIQTYPSSEVEVCNVTSHEEFKMTLLALKSFLFHSQLKARVLIFDDGTLRNEDVDLIKQHLVDVELIKKEKFDKRVISKFGKRSVFLDYKNIPYVVKKLGAILFTRGKKVIFLDSDVLFFKEPKHIKKWLEGSYRAFYLRDCKNSYLISNIEAHALFGVDLIPKLNSGFIGLNREDLDVKVLEKLVGIRDKLYSYRLDHYQAFFSIILTRFKRRKVYALPANDYLVSEDRGRYKNLICGHYVKSVRNRFFDDGWRALGALKNPFRRG